jgi:hypothetical protein
MLMNPYDLNELLFITQTAGVRRHFTEFTDNNGDLGDFLFLQR